MEYQENKMGTHKILPLLISMSVPPTISMLVNSLYNIVDSIFVASLGTDALTAVSLAFPIQNLILAIAVGSGIGVNSYAARKLGERNQLEADSTASHGIVLAVIHYLLLCIAGFIFIPPFFNMFTDNSRILEMGYSYTYIVTFLSFGTIIQIAIEKIIQATGDTVSPMILQIIGAVVNIILDPIMIYGYFGFPAMGVSGAALATICGQMVSLICSVYVLYFRNKDIKADLLKTEVAMLEVDSNIVQVKNLIDVEMKRLKIETGLQNEQDLQLVGFTVPEALSEGINFDVDMVTAKTQSLDALIAKNNVEYAKAEKMVAFSDNLPKVNAFVQYGGYERESLDDTFQNEEWRGGVSVSWELFNFGSGIDSYRAANESYKIEKLNDSIAQDNIEINLTTAYSEVIRLEKLRTAMRSSLEASQENYNIDTERYKAGLLSTQDYLNSEAQLRQSKVDYNQAEADYLVAFEKYRSLLI